MNTILVLTDFSEEANHAARFTIALADQLKVRKIILYHSSVLTATASPSGFASYVSYTAANENSAGQEQMSRLKNELLSLTPAGHIEIEAFNDNRPLTEAIDDIALQKQADMIVIGATVKGGWEESVYGGNTMTIVNQCTKPLLIVPKNVRSGSIKNILLACDLKEVSKTVPVHTIQSFTDVLQARLYILNVDYKEKHFRAETILEQTELHKAFDKENAEFHYIDNEDIADGILTFAGDHDIRLLVTIRKEHGLLGEIFHKSVAKKLIFNATIPVLVLKEQE